MNDDNRMVETIKILMDIQPYITGPLLHYLSATSCIIKQDVKIKSAIAVTKLQIKLPVTFVSLFFNFFSSLSFSDKHNATTTCPNAK